MDIVQSIFDPETFRQSGHRLIDQLTDYMLSARKGEMAVLPEPNPSSLEQKYQQSPPLEPAADAGTCFAERVRELIAESNHLHHPGYIGHQVGPAVPAASLAELVAGTL